MKKISVVIVDDENRIRRGIERMVQSAGDVWDIVGSFQDPNDLLDRCSNRELTFDLLITDIKMPGLDGLTLISKLKNYFSFHALVISGYDDFSYLQKAMREGTIDYLLKPLEREDFHLRLASAKEKIENDRNREKEITSIRNKASSLTYTNQLQMLSNTLVEQGNIDISMMEWTRDFPNGNFLLFHFSMDKSDYKMKSISKSWLSMWAFAMENILKETYENSGRVSADNIWVWNAKNYSYWVLVVNEHLSEKAFEEIGIKIAEQCRDNIQLYTPITATVCMSNTFKDLSSLSSVSENLLQLLQFRLVYGGNKLFTLQLMEKWMSQSQHTDKLEKLQRDIDQFIIALNSMNRPLIRKLLRRFFKNLQVLPSPKEILLSLQSFCIRILNDVIMQNRFRFNDEVIEEGFLLSNMNMATTFSELENKVNEWVQLITEELNSIQKANGFNRIEIAKRWILENLEKQITVEKIAQQVYLNPTYLCEVFKTETGETILDFVTKARISKAKYLLENSNLKIYEVAQKVGYSDTKYFSKLFKRHHGILPSTIKEMKIKKEIEAEK